MKSEEIKKLFTQFEAAASELEGVECWSGRELQKLLGYSKWENFEKVIQKGKEAANMPERKYHTIFLTSGKWSKSVLGQKRRLMISF